MADRPPRKKSKPPAGKLPRRLPNAVCVCRTKDGRAWELVHPRCALERHEDIEEVQSMIDLGETEVAVEELRWLLSGCSEFIEGHFLLGELALGEKDVKLARGHFGFAYQLGLVALRHAGMPTPLPYEVPDNQHFFESGKGLVHCLKELGKLDMAREVVDVLRKCDPTDPLGLGTMLSQLPIIDL